MKRIAKLEAKLEQLIEGMFGNSIHPHDIAVQLARAMEDGLVPAQGNDARPVAPDLLTIHVHPTVAQNLHTDLPTILQSHVVELAAQVNYRLLGHPQIIISANGKLNTHQLEIATAHSDPEANSTAAMQAVLLPQTSRPLNPQLVIDHDRTITLETDVINIGRHPENHITLDDPYVSRHHIQLRLHQGAYILFDTHSRAGTEVNNVKVTEHRLISGDIIKIGQTQLLYLQDDAEDSAEDEETQAFDPFL